MFRLAVPLCVLLMSSPAVALSRPTWEGHILGTGPLDFALEPGNLRVLVFCDPISASPNLVETNIGHPTLLDCDRNLEHDLLVLVTAPSTNLDAATNGLSLQFTSTTVAIVPDAKYSIGMGLGSGMKTKILGVESGSIDGLVLAASFAHRTASVDFRTLAVPFQPDDSFFVEAPATGDRISLVLGAPLREFRVKSEVVIEARWGLISVELSAPEWLRSLEARVTIAGRPLELTAVNLPTAFQLVWDHVAAEPVELYGTYTSIELSGAGLEGTRIHGSYIMEENRAMTFVLDGLASANTLVVHAVDGGECGAPTGRGLVSFDLSKREPGGSGHYRNIEIVATDDCGDVVRIEGKDLYRARIVAAQTDVFSGESDPFIMVAATVTDFPLAKLRLEHDAKGVYAEVIRAASGTKGIWQLSIPFWCSPGCHGLLDFGEASRIDFIGVNAYFWAIGNEQLSQITHCLPRYETGVCA